MSATLYGFAVSHPVQCARAMLRFKGIEHRLRPVPLGVHPVVMRALGFPGGTVPGLVLDGRRVQGTRQISRALDAAVADRPLLPTPEVEEAERWGDEVLQPIPRTAFRYALARHNHVRAAAARAAGAPAPGLVGAALAPTTFAFAQVMGGTRSALDADLRALPGALDHADGLVAAGIIGGEEPNAADFQIGATVAALLAFEDFAADVRDRPVAEVALRHFRPPRVVLPRFLD